MVVAFRNGSLASWFNLETPIPDPPNSTFVTFTPASASSAIPYHTATIVASRTVTSAPTFVVIPPQTKTPVPTRTNTPLPTATRTALPTKTQPVTPTGTPVNQEMLNGILAGNQVVRAIEDYYLNNGKYPSALTDLIPAYLPGVPVTPAGQPFLYRPFDASDPLASEIYWLAFRVGNEQNLTCTYMRRIEYWDCNTASP